MRVGVMTTFLAVCGLAIIGVGIYLQLYPFADWIELGPRGDYFGGFINPILSFMAFIGVLYSINIQRQDTKRQLHAMQLQTFESTFFQMINLHHEIVNSLKIPGSKSDYNGRECFVILMRDLNGKIQTGGQNKEDNLSYIQSGYDAFWKIAGTSFGHYIRYLYNIIKFVDTSNFDDSVKDRYITILRAQLSDAELLMLFYNALTEQGTPFKAYILKYNLLDNLPKNRIRTEFRELRSGLGKIDDLPVLP